MKKKYMMAACACMSCVLLGSGTYVYARPETSVTNHFSTGVVDINLDEYELTANGGEEPFRDYTGKKGENPLIMPGDDISKIPRITNDGNDCYVRAKLEFSGTDVDLEKELYGFPSGWEKHDDGYYYYKNILNTGDKIDIFEGLKIPTDFPQTEEGKTFKLKIDVDAVQSKNFTPNWDDRSPWGDVEIQDCIRDGYDIATFKKADNQSMRVEYQGSSKKLFSNPDDFFQNFPVMMPGDTYKESAGLVNNSKTPIKLYFRSEVTDKSELLDEVKIKIYATIDGKRSLIYNGPMVNSQITDCSDDICQMIQYHHENIDGSGYYRLTEIPLGSRIIRICDVYDAMTSIRPYHTGKSMDETMNYIRSHAGILFDESLVQLFSIIIQRKKEI